MSENFLAPYTRPQFIEAGMSEDDIDELLTEHGPSGFQTVSIPKATAVLGGTVPIERREKRPLKRVQSQKALDNKLPEPVEGERRFFRTWVRAVRRDK